MNKILNVVFYKDIKKVLYDEKFNLIVVKKDNDFYISEIDLDLNTFNSYLKNYVCYDYDKLKDFNKICVKDYVVNLIKKEDKIYTLKK